MDTPRTDGRVLFDNYIKLDWPGEVKAAGVKKKNDTAYVPVARNVSLLRKDVNALDEAVRIWRENDAQRMAPGYEAIAEQAGVEYTWEYRLVERGRPWEQDVPAGVRARVETFLVQLSTRLVSAPPRNGHGSSRSAKRCAPVAAVESSCPANSERISVCRRALRAEGSPRSDSSERLRSSRRDGQPHAAGAVSAQIVVGLALEARAPGFNACVEQARALPRVRVAAALPVGSTPAMASRPIEVR
jgi:hypothetical protein